MDKITEQTGMSTDWILVPSRIDETGDPQLPLRIRYGLHGPIARRLDRVVTSQWIGSAVAGRSLPEHGDGGTCWYHDLEGLEDDWLADGPEIGSTSTVPTVPVSAERTDRKHMVPPADRPLFLAILAEMSQYDWVKGTRRTFYAHCEQEVSLGNRTPPIRDYKC